MTMPERFRRLAPLAARLVTAARSLPLPMAALALALWAMDTQSEPLGRIFFTPERRAAMERQRQLNIQEKTKEDTVEVASVHLNGVVRRKGNKDTVWVNGRVQRNDDGNTDIHFRPALRDSGRVSVGVGDEPLTSLRIGETLNRATGEKTDGLAGGQLQINASPATPRQR